MISEEFMDQYLNVIIIIVLTIAILWLIGITVYIGWYVIDTHIVGPISYWLYKRRSKKEKEGRRYDE